MNYGGATVHSQLKLFPKLLIAFLIDLCYHSLTIINSNRKRRIICTFCIQICSVYHLNYIYIYKTYCIWYNNQRYIAVHNITILTGVLWCYYYTIITRYLQYDLDWLVEWSQLWQLHFNDSKCKVLHMGNSNPSHSYTMSNIPLTRDSWGEGSGCHHGQRIKVP